MIDVLVVGGGPAGRALAAECGPRGLATTLVDPAPHAPWRATYGAWLDELPAGLPAPAAAARGRVIALTAHDLDRIYAVLDVPALRAHLDARLAAAGVRVVAGRVVGPSTAGVRCCSPTAPASTPTRSSTRAATAPHSATTPIAAAHRTATSPAATPDATVTRQASAAHAW